MKKITPTEHVMRYFEEEDLVRCEIMLEHVQAIVRKRNKDAKPKEVVKP